MERGIIGLLHLHSRWLPLECCRTDLACVGDFMGVQWEIGDLMHGRFRIYDILRGGMGIIYIVYDQTWHHVYAAKTFQDEIFASSSVIAERFRQEALIWINLDIIKTSQTPFLWKTLKVSPIYSWSI